MNKNIEIQLDNKNFWQIETFIDQISEVFQLEHTYYGNILTVIADLFEYFTSERPGDHFILDFEAGHEGLVFEVDIKVESPSEECAKLSPETMLLLQTLTDDFEIDLDELHFKLFFDTKSVFNLMSKERAQTLKNYLKGEEKKVKKHNDLFQGN